MSSKKLKISVKELVLYCICGAFVLWGLTYVVLGLLAENLPIPDSKNALYSANLVIKNTFGLGFLGWGLILTGVFAVAGAIVMLTFAKGVDKEYEKKQRRAARLSRSEEPVSPEVVDAEVK